MDIRIENLQKKYDSKTVFEGFTAVLKEGRVTCITGKSGCGKTTLLNILLGLEKADAGTITGMPEKAAVVFQEDRLLEPFRAGLNVRLAAKGKTEEEIRAIFEEFGMQGEIQTPVQELSGGMKRRVAIARALLADSDILVLDEPFKGLDEATKEKVIERVLREKKTILLVSHDLSEAERMHADILKIGED